MRRYFYDFTADISMLPSAVISPGVASTSPGPRWYGRHRGLTPREKQAVRAYTANTPEYSAIKAAAGSGEGNADGVVLFNALRTRAAPEDIYLYRAFPDTDQLRAFYAMNCSPRRQIMSFSFTQQTLFMGPSGNNSRCCMVRLFVPQGTVGVMAINDVSTIPSEDEVLVGGSARIRPTGNAREHGGDGHGPYTIHDMVICDL